MSWFNRDRETIKHNAAFVAEEIHWIHAALKKQDENNKVFIELLNEKQHRTIKLRDEGRGVDVSYKVEDLLQKVATELFK